MEKYIMTNAKNDPKTITKPIQVWLTEEERHRLTLLAERQHRSLSNCAKVILVSNMPPSPPRI